jgi:hypothetical protein
MRNKNRFPFDPGTPPRCQACTNQRLQWGEPIQRLVHKPRTVGYCVDCDAEVWNDRPLKKAA